MSTDLFHKYYDNPTKSAIYTNLKCNADSADEMSFDINASNGEITTNSELLASIGLAEVHVPISQYTQDMKILEPNQYAYIKGMVHGETLGSKTFGRIPKEMVDEDWDYKTVIFFVIKYLDLNNGHKVIRSLKICPDNENDKTFIEVCNEYFQENDIFVELSYNDRYLTFTSTKIGYDFWVDHVMLWESSNDVNLLDIVNDWIVTNGYQYRYGWDDDFIIENGVQKSNPYTSKNVYSSVIIKSDYSRLYNLMTCLDTDFQSILEQYDVKKVHLYEDITKYKAPIKYRNGAMKGVIMVVTYPQYNADSISDYQRAIKIVNMQDRVEEYYAIPESLFDGTYVGVRKLMDVIDTYHSEYDSNQYDRLMGYYTHINGGDNWIDEDEVPNVVPQMMDMWESSNVPLLHQAQSIYKDIETRDAMGLEGFCVYATKHNLWSTLGQFYAKTTIPDDPTYPDCKNLIPSILVYNPNPFPVKIKYLTFA